MTDLTLYDYWRSTAAYRVRLALNVKGLAYNAIPVNLKTGEHRKAKFLALNPHGALPMLETAGMRITQSLAIIEYLEEAYPTPALLPERVSERTSARSIAQLIAADIHPLNVPRVMKQLSERFSASEEAKSAWMVHWISEGLRALELLVKETTGGEFCVGDQPSIADCCLIPQLYSARRFGCPLDAYPTLTAIDKHCNRLSAFEKSKPENQQDAEK